MWSRNSLQTKDVQQYAYTHEIEWFHHMSHNSEVVDPVERWNWFLKSQLWCQIGGNILNEILYYRIQYRLWTRGHYMVLCPHSQSAPVTRTLTNLLTEFLFLVLATLRWFEDLSLQRGMLPLGPSELEAEIATWPLWGPYASEPAGQKKKKG